MEGYCQRMIISGSAFSANWDCAAIVKECFLVHVIFSRPVSLFNSGVFYQRQLDKHQPSAMAECAAEFLGGMRI